MSDVDTPLGRVLVVGGSGMIGSEIVRHLRARGDEPVILSRRGPADEDPADIATVPRIIGDYTRPEGIDFAGVEHVVFAAGQDIRHVSADEEDRDYWDRMQVRGVPAFAAAARAAGVQRFVQIGSYYHQLHPEWAARIPYVAARKEADDRTRALTTDRFAAITINPPSIVGATRDADLRRFAARLRWLRGQEGPQPAAAPPGGTNFMSSRSLAEAVIGALLRGEPGRAYVVGDANLSYAEFFRLLAEASGVSRPIPVVDEECPYQLDRFIVQGRGGTIAFTPDPAEDAVLRYRRGDVPRAIAAIVARLDVSLD